MSTRATLGVLALGLGYLAFRSRSVSTVSPSFVATGASGEEGGARWEVYRRESGNWGYRILARLVGDPETSIIAPVDEFSGLREAVEAARAKTSDLCALPDYDCTGEPPPKVQAQTLGP